MLLDISSVGVLLALTSIADALPKPGHRDLRRPPPLQRRSLDNCSSTAVHKASAPFKNIWYGLSDDEVTGLLDWLHDPAQGLNLTAKVDAGPWDNTVGVTELLHPNKTHALAYLDGGGPVPARNARVGIFVGASEESYLQDYIVGPIPVTNCTTIAPLEYIYNKGNGKQRNYLADDEAQNAFMAKITASIKDITLDLLGTSVTGADDDASYLWGNDPLWNENGRIISWVQFWVQSGDFDSSTVLPQGLYLKFDITGRDQEGWSLEAIMYNSIIYSSVEEFRAAWESPAFVRLAKAIDGPWTGSARSGEELPYDTEPAPVMVETHKRYAVDEESRYIQWMDFSFYMGFSRDTGAALYDIKYKGERIIYELGLQEALAHYAGNDPVQSGTAYLDSYYGFGPNVFTLVPGFDCPASATYLSSSVHDMERTTSHPGSICIFEQDAGFPITRHTAGNYVSTTKNIIFIVRWIATIGNYDYLFDYQFSMDGTIEVRVRASGYIQAAYYVNNTEYGYQIHDALSGSMHDHVLNWKLDMDINGTANSFETVKVAAVERSYPWSDGPRNTMHIERSFLATEDEGKLDWIPNSAGMYTVVNKGSVNQFGELRGYRIAPGMGSPAHLTVQNSNNLRESGHFAEHNLFVTKQKDTEPRSAAAANAREPSEPLVNFAKFFNGESLDQEDLVIWFNLGMHHVPHTGDLPNTAFTTAQSSIQIIPHNYLLSDPSRQTSQGVLLDLTDKKAPVAIYQGVDIAASSCVVDEELFAFPDLSSYPAPEVVRKFPHVIEA